MRWTISLCLFTALSTGIAGASPGTLPACENKDSQAAEQKTARAVKLLAQKIAEDAKQSSESCFSKALKQSNLPGLSSVNASSVPAVSGGESLAALQHVYGGAFTKSKTTAVEKKFKADYFGGQKLIDDQLLKLLGPVPNKSPEEYKTKIHRDLGIASIPLSAKDKKYKLEKSNPMIGGAYLLYDRKKNMPPQAMVIQSRVCKNPKTGKISDTRGSWRDPASCADPNSRPFEVVGIFKFHFDPKTGVITLNPNSTVECTE